MNTTTIGRRTFLGATGALLAAVSRRSPARAATAHRIATFSCDVTPPLGTPIYSSFKPLETIEFPLLAKGVILEDGGGRSVLCAVDYCELCNETYDAVRARIAKAAGTDSARVAVQTVHQHTAPMADAEAVRIVAAIPDPPPFPAESTFSGAIETIAAAVSDAVARLQPFDRVGTSQARVERVASNRRVPIGNGKVGFRASSCKDPALIAKPEGLIDPFLKTISFANGDTVLARIHYYATHPQSFYGDPRASYDFAGMARERMEKEENVFQIYFTGCAGDIAAGKYNNATPEARQGLYERLYDAMSRSAAKAEFGPAENVVWHSAQMTLGARDDDKYVVEKNEATLRDTAALPSVRFDAALARAWRDRDRTQRPIDVTAMRMGKIWVLHLPGEPMIAYQLFAQAQRPDEFVAVAGYGDCGTAYICLDTVFDEGGYESGATHLPKGSEWVVKETIRVAMRG